ncbi:MAG: hypothetical protein VR68_11560 [Peptococcaceae bacterium BRH_c4a]|nr:MAG: hypothetical protein VR68_11560 [Peptococcaceae bacterium BRH_c4a]
MRFAIIDSTGAAIQINEAVGEIDAIEDINARLPKGQLAIECGEDITLDHYYSAGQFKPITVSVDKATITANGVDTASITAHVPDVLSEITFYHADTGKPMTTVPVDPATHTAALQVAATTPGTIHIRVGEPTRIKLNEVVITAQ